MKPTSVKVLRNEYDANLSSFEKVRYKAYYLLRQEIDRRKIPFHSLDKRVKSFVSFIDKSKRQNISRPFEIIHDIVALRVVCFFRLDILEIAEAVKRIFCVISEDDKTKTRVPEEFGYEAIHLDVKFKDKPSESAMDMIFEVQIRTIAQDAWASVSHYLDYKKEYSISDTVRKDLFALQGLFHVADTQFEMLKHRYKEQRI